MLSPKLNKALGALALAASFSIGAPALAEFPANWYVEGVQDLLAGNVISTAIQADGGLTLSAELKQIGRLKETGILDAARLPDGRLVVGTSQEGGVWLVEAGKEPKSLLSLGQDMVTAVASTANGRIYAAATGGRLYAGTVSEGLKLIYTGAESYIWDILTLPDGRVYYVTGNSGALYELKGNTPQLLYRSQESNLRTLWHDAKWGLLVGGGSKAVVYRYIGNQRMEALLEVPADEVTAISGDGKGQLFAAVNRNQIQKGQNKSAVFRIDAAGQSELLFPLEDETVFSLALNSAGTLFMGTGNAGRVYTLEHPLSPDKRTLSLPARSLATQVSALVPGPNQRVLVFGSSPATVEEYQGNYRNVGVYESSVFAADMLASWGMLHVNAVQPPGTQIVVMSRSGNTETPDGTWSDWSKPYSNPSEVQLESPRGRFLQLKFELRTNNDQVTPRLHSFEVSFLRDNQAPTLHSVFVLQRGVYFTPHTVGNLEGPRLTEINPQNLAKLERPLSNEEIYADLLAERTEPVFRMVQKFKPGMLTIAWDAEDPNADLLRYEVYYQSYGQSGWQLLADQLNQPVYSFDTASLPDGQYRFRVYAKDGLSNPGAGYRVYRDSELILVDNTAPTLKQLSARVNGQSVEVGFEAEDGQSPLAYAEYTLDGQNADLLAPVDRIIDGRQERFGFKLPLPAGKGPHTIAIKISDRLGNISTGQARFEVK